jgi:hypothetical protein
MTIMFILPLALNPTSFAHISMPLNKSRFGLIGGFTIALLGATSIIISFSLARTSGAGTRFCLRGGEVAGLSVELTEKRVTVLDP